MTFALQKIMMPALSLGSRLPVGEPAAASIVLADDMTLFREALVVLCEASPRYRVVGQCSDGTTALRLIHTLRPDIAVLDLNLPDMFALEIVRRVRVENLPTRLLVLSQRRDSKMVVEALRAGVSGFLLKSGPASQLLEAFEQVRDGGVYISPLLELDQILSATRGKSSGDPLESLSAREHQVFSLLVEGVRAKEIAARLELSPKTIDTYRASLMRKLDIHDVAGLVKFAIQRNLTSSH
ncbi:MAG: response regulator transcription factor [Bryobacteraceae bacterium]